MSFNWRHRVTIHKMIRAAEFFGNNPGAVAAYMTGLEEGLEIAINFPETAREMFKEMEAHNRKIMEQYDFLQEVGLIELRVVVEGGDDASPTRGT